MSAKDQTESPNHSEEMQDIISSPPAWLLHWGILLFFGVLFLLFALSAFIRYPDIVKTQLKINSANPPKAVVAKKTGMLVKILVAENEPVAADKSLAYLESTAAHEQVLQLLTGLKRMQEQLYKERPDSVALLETPADMQLGEVQASYQSFFQSYLSYKSSVAGGVYLKKKTYLQQDLESIKKQKEQLLSRKEMQETDYQLAEQDYSAQQKLAEQKVIAPMELKKEESKLLGKKYPLVQMETDIISNTTSYSSKEKEIMELDNQIAEERFKFIQALNSLVSDIETWKANYVLSAPLAGNVVYAGIIQEKQFVNASQEIFYVNPGNTDFFGEINIPQYNMGKVNEKQQVLIKLKSYPYEEYGMIKGSIGYIADVPYHDSVFISRVNFSKTGFSEIKRPIKLKNGMMADAEIITEDASLLARLYRNLVKMIK